MYEGLLDKTGPVDCVIFSGDLVQQGQAAEYERFSDIIREIFDHLAAFGPAPHLVAVPGNHDLVRPKMGGPFEVALRSVPNDTAILRQVWEPSEDYLPFIVDTFRNFTDWQEGMIAEGIHANPVSRGAMPGDMAFEFEIESAKIGIVALNSAWLQLTGEDYRQRLHVDPRQLIAASSGDPVKWCRNHDINLLISHHPTNWLHPSSVEAWESDIFPPSRFDLHLYGHMHEHDAQSIVRGGSAARRQLQAASIFGLEQTSLGLARTHGYSVAEIGERYGHRGITVWPRILRKMAGGERKLVADQDLELTEDNNFTWDIAPKVLAESEGAGSSSNENAASISLEQANAISAEARARLEKLRYHLLTAKAHSAVRGAERAAGLEALQRDGVIWLSVEWGQGADGFIWSLFADAGQADVPIFRLDLQEYRSRESYFAELRATIGCSFEQLCEYLSTLPTSILLLDNIPVRPADASGERPIERDLEEVAGIVREYSASAKVVLNGRPRKSEITYQNVNLKPFEEPDVLDYVRAHELGGEAYATPEIISVLWRHSSGSPIRLDTVLRDLQVTSVADLINCDPEYTAEAAIVGVPSALVDTIRELQEAPALERAYALLEALTALPRGEQLDRIKRFLGPHPFYASHAMELSTRGLVETIHLTGMAMADANPTAKALVVPKIVRDFVRNSMTPQRRRFIDRMARELYFGENWLSGEIRYSPAAKRCADPLCEPYEIINACSLIQRTALQCREEDNSLNLDGVMRLASAFVEVLMKGDHFRDAAQLCEQIDLVVPDDGNERSLDILRFEQARAIRMLGRNDEARQIFLQLDRNHLSADQKRSMNLQLALIAERLGDREEAARYAREILKAGRIDAAGIQAQQIIAEQMDDTPTRMNTLATLEQRARNRKLNVAANNIALARAELESNRDAKIVHLTRVILSADSKLDFYNGVRATLGITKLQRSKGPRSLNEISRLIRTYQHLHNERGTSLFDQCHDALWSAFWGNGDFPNLLRLSRYSSLIWRLRSQEDREEKYLTALAAELSDTQLAALKGLDREVAYYKARRAALLDRQTKLVAAQSG